MYDFIIKEWDLHSEQFSELGKKVKEDKATLAEVFDVIHKMVNCVLMEHERDSESLYESIDRFERVVKNSLYIHKSDLKFINNLFKIYQNDPSRILYSRDFVKLCELRQHCADHIVALMDKHDVVNI